eukprot:12781138-Ditylum_brightwellii.AAC.1
MEDSKTKSTNSSSKAEDTKTICSSTSIVEHTVGATSGDKNAGDLQMVISREQLSKTYWAAA